MTGLMLIAAEASGPRLDAAIEVAAANAALGRPVLLFLTGPAAALSSPTIDGAIALLAELGAELAICQTAMATHGLTADQLPTGLTPQGAALAGSCCSPDRLLLA
jgi:predicted peroxiredoxin